MKRNGLIVKIFISFLPIYLVFVPILTTAEQNQDQMKVHFINVGQGDSILIEMPNGKKILIDGGPPSAGDKVVQYLQSKNIHTLDFLITTHPDFDHIGGLIPVIKKFDIKRIIENGKWHYTHTYFEYVSEVKKRDIPVTIAKVDEVKLLDKYITLKFLNTSSVLKDNNEGSIALALSYKRVDFLLMGDVEREQELAMVDKYDLKSEILKVPHHGSDTSSSWGLLQEVKPEKAIISYSADNDFGHPVESTIDKLLAAGATIYSTAKAGDIVITTDGHQYTMDISGTGRLVIP